MKHKLKNKIFLVYSMEVKRGLKIIDNILLYAMLAGGILFLLRNPGNILTPPSLFSFFALLFILNKLFKFSELELFLLLINVYLHILGDNTTFGLYERWFYYDKLMHFFSWALIAIVVILRLDRMIPKKYKLEKYLLAFFSVLGLEALWEIIEYFEDIIFGFRTQGVYINGVMVMNTFTDTMYDMTFTALGILTVLVIFFIYKKYSRKEKLEK